MDDPKHIVLNLRISAATMAALEERALIERRPVRTMAALLLEDALNASDELDAMELAPADQALIERSRQVFARPTTTPPTAPSGGLPMLIGDGRIVANTEAFSRLPVYTGSNEPKRATAKPDKPKRK